MAKRGRPPNRNNSDGKEIILILVAIAVIFIFTSFVLMILIFFHYNKLRKILPISETSHRVFDFMSILMPFIISTIVMIIWVVFVFFLKSIPILAIVTFITSFILYKFSNSAACLYYGVVIDFDDNKILLPIDMINYTFIDYVSLRFIEQLGDMEYVALSEIKRLSREKGESLYIHGNFGSRELHFSNKQKRDECISAIQNATRVPILNGY